MEYPLGDGWQLVMAGFSDVGTRAENDDAYLINEELGLAVVCDGVGSVDAGGLGARLVVELVELLAGTARELRVTAPLKKSITLANLVLKGVRESKRRIRWGLQDRAGVVTVEGFGLGSGGKTTLVALMGSRSGLEIVWAGDSRCYRVTREGLEQLTIDDAGDGGALTQYMSNLGQDFDNVRVMRDVVPGDMLLLCSDGLYKSGGTGIAQKDLSTLLDLPIDDGREATRRRLLEEAVRSIVLRSVDAARERGVDNTTVVLVRVERVPPEMPTPGPSVEETRIISPPSPPDSPTQDMSHPPSMPPPPKPPRQKPAESTFSSPPRRHSWLSRAVAAVVVGCAVLAGGFLLLKPGRKGQNSYSGAVTNALNNGHFSTCNGLAGDLLLDKQVGTQPVQGLEDAVDLCSAAFLEWRFPAPQVASTKSPAPSSTTTAASTAKRTAPAATRNREWRAWTELQSYLLRIGPTELHDRVRAIAGANSDDHVSTTREKKAVPKWEREDAARLLAKRSERAKTDRLTASIQQAQTFLRNWGTRKGWAKSFLEWIGQSCYQEKYKPFLDGFRKWTGNRTAEKLSTDLKSHKCTPTPTPTATPTPSPSPTPTATPKPMATATPTPIPTATSVGAGTNKTAPGTKGEPKPVKRARKQQGNNDHAAQRSTSGRVRSVATTSSGSTDSGSKRGWQLFTTSKRQNNDNPCEQLQSHLQILRKKLKKDGRLPEKLRSQINGDLEKITGKSVVKCLKQKDERLKSIIFDVDPNSKDHFKLKPDNGLKMNQKAISKMLSSASNGAGR